MVLLAPVLCFGHEVLVLFGPLPVAVEDDLFVVHGDLLVGFPSGVVLAVLWTVLGVVLRAILRVVLWFVLQAVLRAVLWSVVLPSSFWEAHQNDHIHLRPTTKVLFVWGRWPRQVSLFLVVFLNQ
jgi:hypothetical protein